MGETATGDPKWTLDNVVYGFSSKFGGLIWIKIDSSFVPVRQIQRPYNVARIRAALEKYIGLPNRLIEDDDPGRSDNKHPLDNPNGGGESSSR